MINYAGNVDWTTYGLSHMIGSLSSSTSDGGTVSLVMLTMTSSTDSRAVSVMNIHSWYAHKEI